jgi:hypothetical protein
MTGRERRAAKEQPPVTRLDLPRDVVTVPTRVELLHPKVVEFLRSKTPAERWEMISAANRSLQRRLEHIVAQQHPDWSIVEVRAEIARRRLRGSG